MKKIILVIPSLLFVWAHVNAQTIVMNDDAPFPTGVCPGVTVSYTIQNIPSDLAHCQINWDISTNGQFQSGNTSSTVQVLWDDSDPNSAELSATFTCSDGSTTTAELTQTIATVSQETIDPPTGASLGSAVA